MLDRSVDVVRALYRPVGFLLPRRNVLYILYVPTYTPGVRSMTTSIFLSLLLIDLDLEKFLVVASRSN